MKIEALQTSQVKVDVNVKEFVRKVFSQLQHDIISEAKLEGIKEYDGGAFINASGIWIGVIDSLGRGSDTHKQIRPATEWEIKRWRAIVEVESMVDLRQWS